MEIQFKITKMKSGKIKITGGSFSQLERALKIQLNNAKRNNNVGVIDFIKKDLKYVTRAKKNPNKNNLYHRKKRIQVIQNSLNAYGGVGFKTFKTSLMNIYKVNSLRGLKAMKPTTTNGKIINDISYDNWDKLDNIISCMGGIVTAIDKYPDVLQAKADYYGIDLEQYIESRTS